MPLLQPIQNLKIGDNIEVARNGQKFNIDGNSIADASGPAFQRPFNWIPGYQFSEVKPPVNNSSQLFQQTAIGYAPFAGYAAGSTSSTVSSWTTSGGTPYFDNNLIGTNLASSVPAAGLVTTFAAFPVNGGPFVSTNASPWYAATYIRIMASTGYSTVFGVRSALNTTPANSFGAWVEYDPAVSQYWQLYFRVNGGSLQTINTFVVPQTSAVAQRVEIGLLPNNRVQVLFDGTDPNGARSLSGSATTGGSVLNLVAGSYRTTATGSTVNLVSRFGTIQSRVNIAAGTGVQY